MRIRVTVRTFAEWQASVTRFALGIVDMAFVAFDALMKSGQRIARFRMVELARDIFPIVIVVALLAVRAQASFMRIFMTTSACR